MGAKKKAARRLVSKKTIEEVRAGGVDVRRPWLQNWLPLVSQYETPQLLADEIGVTYNTLRRWGARGALVPEPTAKIVRIIAEKKGVEPPI